MPLGAILSELALRAVGALVPPVRDDIRAMFNSRQEYRRTSSARETRAARNNGFDVRRAVTPIFFAFLMIFARCYLQLMRHVSESWSALYNKRIAVQDNSINRVNYQSSFVIVPAVRLHMPTDTQLAAVESSMRVLFFRHRDRKAIAVPCSVDMSNILCFEVQP